MEALYRKHAREVATFLGQGLDLKLLVPPEGYTSALLTMAMLKDHEIGPYTSSSSAPLLKYPCQNACPHFYSCRPKLTQHPPAEAATDDHDRFGSSLEEPGLAQLLLEAEAEVCSTRIKALCKHY